MFTQTGKQQGPVILNPEIAPGLDKLLDPSFTFGELIRRFEVLLLVPVQIGTTFDRESTPTDWPIVLYTQEKVDSGLFVCIY